VRRIWILAALAAAVLSSANACAWGPAAHAYLAVRITGRQTPGIVYGAMLTDVNGGVVRNRSLASKLAGLTHNEFERLEPSEFATGFATHNNEWGTDHYVHLHHNPKAPDIYSTTKMRQFSKEFGISMHEAEGAFDLVMEYVVRRDYGPELGALIVESASASTHEEELVQAFAQPLAERAGISREHAAKEIRKAARVYQTLAIAYGEQLAKDEAHLRKLAAYAIRLYMGCDLETAKRYFARCVEICEPDYEEEIAQMCETIRGIMKARPEYGLP